MTDYGDVPGRYKVTSISVSSNTVVYRTDARYSEAMAFIVGHAWLLIPGEQLILERES